MKRKRVLSFFLSICICISIISPVSASALGEAADSSTTLAVTSDADIDSNAPAEEPGTDVTNDTPTDEPGTDVTNAIPAEEPDTDITNDAPTDEPGTDVANDTPAEEPGTDVTNDTPTEGDPSVEFPDMSDWILLGFAPIQSMSRANNTWGIYISKRFNNAPNDSNNYIVFRSYGTNIHTAYNSADGKTYPAYCLDWWLSSSSSADYNYSIESLPSSAYYQAAKYVAALGYGNNTTDRLKQMFGYTVNYYEAAQATQAAIWAAQFVSNGDYDTVDDSMSKYLRFSLNPAHSDSNALNLARDMANAGLSIWKDGISLSSSAPVFVSETPGTTTYRFTVTAKNCYGGYTVAVSGLPTGTKITGTSGVTVSDTTAFSSTTANGTNTITVTIPKAASAKTYSVKLSLKSYNQNYTNNNSVIYADSNDSDDQDILIVGTGGLSPKTASATLSMPVARLRNAQITITKRDAVSNEVIPNVEFALYEWNGTAYVDTGKTAATNESGVATFTDLWYTATNIGVFQVYEKSSATHAIFTNHPVCTVSITSGNWWAYSSATAQQTTGTATMNSSGSYDISFHFTAYNEPKAGSIIVSKRDSVTGVALPGAVFRLYQWQANAAWSGSDGQYVATDLTATTNASGKAVFSDLIADSSNVGKFRVTEESAPEGYTLDSAFCCNIAVTDCRYNYLSSFASQSGALTNGGTITADINGTVRDIVTVSPDDAGYHFTVYAYDQPAPRFTEESLSVSKITENADGSITYLSGAAFVLQAKSSDGTWSDCCTFEEDAVRERYRLPTDENGDLIFTPEFGRIYRVIETSAPNGVINSGWQSDPFTWTENNVATINFTAEDEIPTGALQLKKTDAETGLPLAGVTFAVTSAEDITYTLNDTVTTVYRKGAKIADLTTSADGTAVLTDLYYGTYTITEISTADNYLFEETVFNAVVGAPAGYDASKTYPESSGIGVTVYSGVSTITDYEEYRSPEYAKYVKDNDGYVIRYSKAADGSYTQTADGAYAQVEYASVTNTPLHPKMSVAKLADQTTDEQGGSVSFDIATGRYTETKVPGTYFNGQTVTFTLTATNAGNVDLYNLYMVDVMSSDIWTVVKQPADVTFRAADGSELTADSTVKTTQGNTATITSVTYDDANRTYTIYFDKLAAGDSVSCLMTFTLYNYDNINKDSLPNDVYLYGQYLSNGTSGTPTDVPTSGEDDCHDDDAINVVSLGSITIHKTDGYGNSLQGVVFQLSDSSGSPVPFVLQADGSYAASVIADNGDWIFAAQSGLETTTDLITDANGRIDLKALPFGKYSLIETETAEGHLLLKEPISITLPHGVSGSEDTSTDDVYYVPGEKGSGINYYFHLTYDISNTAAFRLPATGGIPNALWMAMLGMLMLGISILLLISHRSQSNLIKSAHKGGSTMKVSKRIFSMIAALVMVLGTMTSAYATDLSDAIIDKSKTGSITIYKYDMTAAEEADLSSNGYLSTGKANANANSAFADYAIEGVEFTMLRVGSIKTALQQSNMSNTIQVVYGVSNADLIAALGLSGSDAVQTEGSICYFTSDTLINALSGKLASNNTSTKDALERIVKSDSNAAAMPLTDASGKTSADKLELGLYLIVETKVPENVTFTVDPFLLSVPMTDTQSLDQWFYDITVYPKNQTGNPTLEKEVADADHGMSFSDAEEAYEDVATANAGDTLDYRIISTLPVIHSTATYLTRYDFVDTLSRGIEYNQGDVKICWYADYADALTDYTAVTGEAVTGNGANADAVWASGSEFFSVTYDTAADDATTMTVSITDAGLSEINHPAAAADQTGKYSGWTMVIYYTATVNSDASLVMGDDGNPNDVTLAWSRTTEGYVDTLTDEAVVYSYGIDLTKKFSDNATEGFTDVKFVLQHADITGNNFLVADKAESGVYYITGSVPSKEQATHFSPNSEGKLLIYGLEEDIYTLTEVETADGYTLLKDTITIDIAPSYGVSTPCGSLTASATIDGNDTDMLADDGSANALVPLTVLNTRGFDLPKTGGESTLIVTIFGVLIVGLAVALAIAGHKKKSN